MFCLRQEDEPSDDAKLQDTSISASLTTEELAAALQTTMRKVKVGDEFVNDEKADASFKLIEEVWGEMRSDRLDHRKHVKTSFVAPAAGDVKDLLKEARASQKRETVTGGMLCHEGNESDGRAVLEYAKSIMPIVEDWHTNKCKIANEKQCLFLDAVKCGFQEECNDTENQTVGKSEPLCALICGGPGVGKSYAMLSMKSLFKALGWRQSMQFQFAAFQAVVADQVGAILIRYFVVRDCYVPGNRIHVVCEHMIWVFPLDIGENVLAESYDHESLSRRDITVTPALNHFRSHIVLLT